MSHLLLPRQSSNTTGTSSTLSANVIVTICIIGSVFVCVAIAGVAKMCLTQRPSVAGQQDEEDLFRPHSKSQIDRMREVRWINHMHIWENARDARMECGDGVKQPKPKRKGELLPGGLGHLSAAYYASVNVVPWEEGVSESESGGRQSATAGLNDYSAGSYNGQMNPYVGPYRSSPQSKPKQPRLTYQELEKDSDEDEEGDDVAPLSILDGLPEHARQQLRLPREREFAEHVMARMRPTSDMSFFYGQEEAEEYASAAAGNPAIQDGAEGGKSDAVKNVGVPRIVLNDDETEGGIGQAH